MTKQRAHDELEQQIAELTLDVQRTRADFENYRKRVDGEKQVAQELGGTKMVMKLLPIIDTLDRALVHVPDELVDNQWAMGIIGVNKQLIKMMDELHLKKIEAGPGTLFDPVYHQAVQFDDGEGDQEVITEELQAGYLLNDVVIRHAMVKVTRQ